MSRAAWWGKLGALCCVLAAIGCHDSGAKNKGRELSGLGVSLSGRAFSSDTGQPLSDAPVRVGDVAVASDAQGSFALTYPASTKDKSVEVSAREHAPVRKSAPEGDGYVELFAKRIDAKETVAPDKGGAVKSGKGGALSVKAGSLETLDGNAPAEVELSVAVPDATRAMDLDALPGDFTAKQANQIGKVSTESPVYIDASEKGKKLKLKAGQKANITLPANQKKKATQLTLYRFDETLGIWVDVGPATVGIDADGLAVYTAEVDGFGWFSVGTFIGELSCIRACVVHEDQTAVPFARAVISGVDLFTQSVAFAGQDGCVALDVPANARLTLSVQSEGARAAPQLVQSATGGKAATPDTCLALPAVVVAPTEASSCPLGFSQCGDICADVARDPAHCGGCGQSCGEGLCAGARCVEAVPTKPADRPDAGVGPVLDSSTPSSDAGPPCVGIAEDCFNGVDDDCDSLTDCQDPECDGPAVCGAEGSELGFLQPAGSTCPPGTMADAQPLHQTPHAGSCQGCGCGAVSATSCVATVSGRTGSCTGTPISITPPGGNVISAYACGSAPVSDGIETWAGYHAAFAVTSGSCPPNGSPKPSTLSWSSNAMFCRIMRTGTGCGSGQACLPRNDSNATAVLCSESASGTCAPNQTAQTWYTGADDGRSCGACKCTATGASCSNVKVQFGNDWDCSASPVVVGDGQTVCGPPNHYQPAAMLIGAPTPATCAASAPLQGSILPIGGTTLCCGP